MNAKAAMQIDTALLTKKDVLSNSRNSVAEGT